MTGWGPQYNFVYISTTVSFCQQEKSAFWVSVFYEPFQFAYWDSEFS